MFSSLFRINFSFYRSVYAWRFGDGEATKESVTSACLTNGCELPGYVYLYIRNFVITLWLLIAILKLFARNGFQPLYI